MTAAHTPGPWVWENGSLVYQDDGRTVFVIESIPYEGLWLDDEGPDARLIASAPDLLEALKELHLKTVVGTDAERHNALDMAWRAVSKATGQ